MLVYLTLDAQHAVTLHPEHVPLEESNHVGRRAPPLLKQAPSVAKVVTGWLRVTLLAAVRLFLLPGRRLIPGRTWAFAACHDTVSQTYRLDYPPSPWQCRELATSNVF